MVRRYLLLFLAAEGILAVALQGRHPWDRMAAAVGVFVVTGLVVYRTARGHIELREDEMVVHNVFTIRLTRGRVAGFAAEVSRGTLGATLSLVARVNTGMDTPIFRIANTFGRKPGEIRTRLATLNAWVDPAARAANPSPEDHMGAWMSYATENLKRPQDGQPSPG